MSVYFVRHAGHIKIGKSVDPWKRLARFLRASQSRLNRMRNTNRTPLPTPPAPAEEPTS